MSVYFARSGASGIDVAYGFFDTDNEIVVVQGGSDHLDPMVVVEHELTHVNLTENSSLGWIEQALTALHFFMVLPEYADQAETVLAVRRACLDRLDRLRSSTGVVHEAVAWFGTELMTSGRENRTAPAEYRTTTAALRKALTGVRGLSDVGADRYFHDALHIGEALAIVALSPGNLEELIGAALHDDDDIALSRLTSLLRDADTAPTERFARLCRAIGTLDREAAVRWADQVFEPGAGDPVDMLAATSKKLRPMGFGPHRSARRIVESSLRTFVDNKLPADAKGPARPDIDRFWSNHLVLGRFRKSLDRYSQTCVLGARLLAGDLTYGSDAVGGAPPPDFLVSSAVVVSRAISGDDDRTGWLRPAGDSALIALFGVRIAAHFPWLGSVEDSISRWVTDVGTARTYLREVAAASGQPIVAISVGYDEAVGDFEGMTLIGDVPHVVFRMGSFWNWWRHVAFYLPESEHLDFEWLPMRAPNDDDSPFGYIVIKAAGRPWPIVMIPTCIDKVERAVSVAAAMPSPYGVTLRRAGQRPVEWLGPLAKFPSAAAQAYEAVSC